AMECFRQAQMFNTDGGYALVAMASDLLNTPPEVEFALAMMSKHPERPSLKEHFAAAARGADGLLQRNLKDHFSGEEYAHLK
ncbi:MAG: hypothetical protein CL946_06680, partial [Ectothiorhodospiraceae bacterium]|nr:hypothetical protein [Ectothiorhodospiraceae bacterium]